MSKIISTKGVVVGVTPYLSDLRISLITPGMGKLYAIAKHANSSGSKRKRFLVPGVEISAKLYIKNHYYLSNIEFLHNFVGNLESYFQAQVLKIIFSALDSFYTIDDSVKYLEIIELLKEFKSTRKFYSYAAGLKILELLGLVDLKTGTKCRVCNISMQQGYFCKGGFFCGKHLPSDSSRSFKYNIKTDKGKLQLLSDILDYWQI